MDTATSLRLAAARTTSTASATYTIRRHILSTHASTSTAHISTESAITIMAAVHITGTGASVIIDSVPTIALTSVQERSTIALVIAITTYRPRVSLLRGLI